MPDPTYPPKNFVPPAAQVPKDEPLHIAGMSGEDKLYLAYAEEKGGLTHRIVFILLNRIYNPTSKAEPDPKS